MRSNQKRVRLSGKKVKIGCHADPHCGCACRPCSAGTIVLVTCNVGLDTTLHDLQAVENGRIVRIQPEHQLRFLAPAAADELKRLLEEAKE